MHEVERARERLREMMEPFDDQYWMEHDRDHEFPWDFYRAMAAVRIATTLQPSESSAPTPLAPAW